MVEMNEVVRLSVSSSSLSETSSAHGECSMFTMTYHVWVTWHSTNDVIRYMTGGAVVAKWLWAASTLWCYSDLHRFTWWSRLSPHPDWLPYGGASPGVDYWPSARSAHTALWFIKTILSTLEQVCLLIAGHCDKVYVWHYVGAVCGE